MTSRAQVGLDPQDCPSCGSRFTPYREGQRACSRKCRDALGPIPVDSRQFVITFTCKICGKDGEARTTIRGGRRNFCDDCTDEAARLRKERKNAARRLATAADPEFRRLKNRRYAVARYGLTVEEYDQMFAAQNGVCYLCGGGPTADSGADGRLAIDHDHISGKVRGLLCGHCNRAIGLLRDDPALLRKAAEYIEAHRA